MKEHAHTRKQLLIIFLKTQQRLLFSVFSVLFVFLKIFTTLVLSRPFGKLLIANYYVSRLKFGEHRHQQTPSHQITLVTDLLLACVGLKAEPACTG